MSDQERNRRDASGGDDDSISLRPYVETIRRYRFIIYGTVIAMSVVFFAGVLAMVVVYPTERVASVRFRLLFDGAAIGQYPNKTPFSPTEIVAPPIVTDVFKANDLQKYGAYESFKDSLFVQQSNPQLDLLASDYQARLADTKLSSVDRSRIEAEFSQKREALTDPVFSLSLRRIERFKTLPDDVAEKLLSDTLTTWAIQADRMGAMKYQLPILSSTVLSKESLDTEDYLVAADQLRAKAVRIIDTISELEKVPGAFTTRTPKDGVSLAEIRASIEDALRFDLEPLLGIIRSEGITKNARMLSLYASTQVFQRQLEKQAAEGRARAVQNSLADYLSLRGSRVAPEPKSGSPRPPGFDTTVIPQFSESFLDRLVEMSATTQKSEMEYRQKLTDQVIKENTLVTALDKELAYYQDLVKALHGLGNRATGSAELTTLVRIRSQAAFATIAKGADQLVDLYKELSARNLNPSARLYAITGPFAKHTQGSLAGRPVAYSYVLMLMLTLAVTPIGCLIYDAMKRRRSAA